MKLRFEPPILSDDADISVSQGGETALWNAPEDIPETGDLTGSVTILATRTPLQTAPERVFFEVEPQGFVIPGEGESEFDALFDAQKHELIYHWEFGEAGATYDVPEKMLPQWRDANVAYGPFVGHVYDEPGTYTAKVTVIEPETGRTASASFAVDVADPNDTFPLTNTIYVSTEANFDNAPAGAILLDSLDAALLLTRAPTGTPLPPKRIMLRRGEVFDFDFYRHDWWSYQIHLVAENGPGAKPVIRDTTARTTNLMFLHRRTMEGAEFVYDNIAFEGDWDSSTETGFDGSLAIKVESEALGSVLINHAVFNGISMPLEEQPALTKDMQDMKSMVVAHTEITNWRGMGHYATGASRYAFLGNKYVALPNAMAGRPRNTGGNEHGCVRFQFAFVSKVAIDGMDFFNKVGWYTNSPGVITQQPCIRWNQNSVGGALLNMQRSALEGGFDLLALRGVNFDTVEEVQNLLVERCIFVGSHHTHALVTIDSGGLTFRNNLGIMPDVPRQLGIFQPHGFVRLEGNYEESAMNAPNKVYNNTLINLMTDANAPSGNGAMLMVDNTLGAIGSQHLTNENNLVHQPNLGTPDITHHPIDSTQILWEPREIGYISAEVPVMLTQHATPLNTVHLPRPQSGSTALGGALTGQTSYRDFFGNVRPEPPSIGALEVE